MRHFQKGTSVIGVPIEIRVTIWRTPAWTQRSYAEKNIIKIAQTSTTGPLQFARPPLPRSLPVWKRTKATYLLKKEKKKEMLILSHNPL